MNTLGINPELTWRLDDGAPHGFSPGQWGFHDDGSAWMCFKSIDTIDANDTVVLQPDFDGRRLTKSHLDADLGTPIGVVATDIANGEYGWMQIYGFATAYGNGAIDNGANLYTDGTAGYVDDVSTNQTRIHRFTPIESITGAGLMRVHLNWPSGRG